MSITVISIRKAFTPFLLDWLDFVKDDLLVFPKACKIQTVLQNIQDGFLTLDQYKLLQRAFTFTARIIQKSDFKTLHRIIWRLNPFFALDFD